MNVRGIIVNREVSISFYCQFVAGLVHFWNIYTGGTLYAAFSPVCDLFFSLWIYILRLRQSLENKYKLAYFTFSNVETKKKKENFDILSVNHVSISVQEWYNGNGIPCERYAADYCWLSRFVLFSSLCFYWFVSYYIIVWNNCKIKC